MGFEARPAVSTLQSHKPNPGPWFAFINGVLLEHRHAHSFAHFLWLLFL